MKILQPVADLVLGNGTAGCCKRGSVVSLDVPGMLHNGAVKSGQHPRAHRFFMLQSGVLAALGSALLVPRPSCRMELEETIKHTSY